MTDIPTWGFFILGVLSAAVAVFLSKNTSKLLVGRSVKEVVDSANSVIELYDKRADALELKVAELTEELAAVRKKLEETLAHNEALQRLLMASPAINPAVSP